MNIEYKDNKVAGGISKDIIVDGDKKGSIYISDIPFPKGYQITTIDRPYKARYFKTLKGGERYIIKNGERFMSFAKALNSHFGSEYIKVG